MSSEAGILELWDTPVLVISRTCTDSNCSSLPHHGPGEPIPVSRRCTGPYYFTIKLDGPGHGSRSRPGLTSRDFKDLGRVYAITPQAELADQSITHDTFLFSRLWARVLFDSGASHSLIAASCVKDLGLEIETLEEPLQVNSPLGTRVSVDQICWDCELEISGILLTVDLRVMDMSEYDVILEMDWLTVHRILIDCDRRRVTAYTPDDVCVMFQGDKHNALP